MNDTKKKKTLFDKDKAQTAFNVGNECAYKRIYMSLRTQYCKWKDHICEHL